MTDKNDKNQDIKFDDIPFLDIDIKGIGGQIVKSLNDSLNRIVNSFEPKKLIPIKDPNVCVQGLPDLSRSKKLRIATVLGRGLSILFIITGLIRLINGFTVARLVWLIVWIMSMEIWRKTDKRSNNYRRLGSNYQRYLRELGNNTVISVKDLASAVHQSEKKTIKDLIYMINNGYFKQGRLVEDNKIFILDIPTYRLYKEKISTISVIEQETEEMIEDSTTQRSEEIINLAMESVKALEQEAMGIESESIKVLIKDISTHSRDVVKIIRKYPDKSYSLNKFSEYYLPTAVTLGEAYKEFEILNTDDEKIINSMTEIENSLKTIGQAFEKIKIELLGDRTMEVQADIETINLLLNQEGYIKDDWSQDE